MPELTFTPATVTFWFEGLLLICPRANQGCEVGIIPTAGHHHPHQRSLKIFQFTRGEPVRIAHPFTLQTNLEISLQDNLPEKGPKGHGQEHGRFNRRGTQTYQKNRKDLRHLPDLNGPEFHNGRLRVQAGVTLPKLIFHEGYLWTDSLTPLPCWKIKYPEETSELFGKLGLMCALEITFNQDKSKLIIKEPSSGSTITLANQCYRRYQVILSNVRAVPACPASSMPNQPSDFMLYYQVLSDPTGTKYDLAVEPKGPEKMSNWPVICSVVRVTNLPNGLQAEAASEADRPAGPNHPHSNRH